jgi:hypothetical protein
VHPRTPHRARRPAPTDPAGVRPWTGISLQHGSPGYLAALQRLLQSEIEAGLPERLNPPKRDDFLIRGPTDPPTH